MWIDVDSSGLGRATGEPDSHHGLDARSRGTRTSWAAPYGKSGSQTCSALSPLRAKKLDSHYRNVKAVFSANYWGGTEGYSPQTDPFFQRLRTWLNNLR
jgi:hypothetical protein